MYFWTAKNMQCKLLYQTNIKDDHTYMYKVHHSFYHTACPYPQAPNFSSILIYIYQTPVHLCIRFLPHKNPISKEMEKIYFLNYLKVSKTPVHLIFSHMLGLIQYQLILWTTDSLNYGDQSTALFSHLYFFSFLLFHIDLYSLITAQTKDTSKEGIIFVLTKQQFETKIDYQKPRIHKNTFLKEMVKIYFMNYLKLSKTSLQDKRQERKKKKTLIVIWWKENHLHLKEKPTSILFKTEGLKMYIPALILLETNSCGFSTNLSILPESS